MAELSCGTAPYTYEWRTSYDGFNYSPVRGTNEIFTQNLPCPSGNYYYIRLEVHSSDGQTSAVVSRVYIDKQRCYGGRLETVDSEGESVLLGEANPNPANNSTEINYYLPQAYHVTIDVIDYQGRKIATLTDEVRPAGNHSSRFNTTMLPVGSYFYCLKAGGQIQTKRMVIIH